MNRFSPELLRLKGERRRLFDADIALLEPPVDKFPEQRVEHRGQGDEKQHPGNTHEAAADGYRHQYPDGREPHRAAYHMWVDEIALDLLEYQEKDRYDNDVTSDVQPFG